MKKKPVLNVDLLYPIGSYYETSNFDFNPNTHFGGTWELEEDGTILVSRNTKTGSKFNVDLGTIVGSEKHTLTIEEMPKHDHSYKLAYGTNSDGNESTGFAYPKNTAGTFNQGNIGLSGDSQPHNNVQPSKVVNRWHRIA